MGKKKADRRLADNEAMARAKMIRVSPQKLNLVCASIRGKSASSAVAELAFSKRRVAKDVKAVLESAIANAENNHQLDVDNLFVAEASVGRAMVMKRWKARARGRVGKIMKPWSNMRIILREREETA
ncbi:50S ribosomal protein L22 [Terasakiella sp. SH-1]|uniref:50S ribosomal protein L22 n=1 Tax=Terasakiella sp. SH-1 TaxID=2560057 RepID=UPI001074205A|nr:50S ribosomal protein L22 [Terasakiella sp. SH-1]